MLAVAGSITLGETIDLTSRAAESVAVVIDDRGRGHVVSVTKNPRSLEHVTLAPDGQLDREVIDAHPSSSGVSAAFGNDGRLHVANGGRVLVNTGGGWKQLDGAPPCEQLTRAGPDLACSFVVAGVKLGISGHC